MMKRFGLSAFWGMLSVAIYLVTITLLLAYFNYKSHDKPKRFVEKNDDAVQIALAAPAVRQSISKPKPKPKPKPKSKVKPKKKPKVKPKAKRLAVKKKSKRVNKRDTNRTRRKPRNAKSLFASVKTSKKPHIKLHDKPIVRKPAKQLFDMVEAKPRKDAQYSLKKRKRKDRGVENAYLAKVQRMLEDWPSQSDFAGEKVKVYLKIRPSGYFDFEFKQKADNPAFNEALRAYLEQLQTIGFGPHKGKRTYLFEAEFVAKE